jgi:serine/threonine-protein kinase
VERGNDKGLSVKLEAQKNYIVGRENPHAAIKLNDPMASRQHFQIHSVNGTFKVRDMKSRNGTLLNDEKLAPEHDADLKVGDKIQVGETIFSFLSDEKEEGGGGLIGKTIGGYRLIERVGRGGMGTVYKAEQISLNREVALKVLSAKLLSDPVFVERFVQEAKAAGGLNHPNIVQVFDVGSDRGVYYFSMEYMDHGSVGDIVQKEGPVPWARALEMMTDAAKGLIFAEKKGIIHRDIKPDNLMLTSEGTVKIGDLGLAKKASDIAGEGGQIFGTPHFIAPEQAQGKAIDQRADIYALGASFYRVLSGKTPFSGENVKEILVKQVQEKPAPLDGMVKDLPKELSSVIGKMMEKKPDDRYRSAQGLFEDLETIRVRYHLEAHGQATSLRRSKGVAVVLGIAAIALGGAVYHYATRDPQIEYRDNPNNRPIDNNPVPVNPTITPEEKADQAFTKVDSDDARLLVEAGGGPAKTWQKYEAKWLLIADRYAAVHKEFPETSKGGEAKSRAEKTRKAIEDAKKAHNERVAAGGAAWTNLLEEFGKRSARPAEAVAFLAAEAPAVLKEWADFLPEKEPAKFIKAKLDGIVAAAGSEVDEALKLLDESAPLFPGDKYLQARKGVEERVPGWTPEASAKDLYSEKLGELVKKVKDGIKISDGAARDAVTDALDLDRAAFFHAYLTIRRWGPESGQPNAEGDTPFFAFKWDDCLAKWDALAKELKTKPYRDRVARKIGHYKRCKRLFETLAARVKAREIKDPDFPEAVRKGTDVILDANRVAEATPEGVWGLRVSTRQKVFLEFREMTPQELYEQFLKKGAGIPFSVEDRLDLAVFLAEAGLGDLAYAESEKAAGTDKATRDWVQEEYQAHWELHQQDGPLALWNQYLTAQKQGMKGSQLEQMRVALKTKIEAVLAKPSFFKSDYFLLHNSLAGPDGQVPDRLFPPEVTNPLLENLGTSGGLTIPKEEATAPLAPSNGDGSVAPPPPPAAPGNDAPPAGGDDGKEQPK